jgi:hypothetical protein
MRKMTLFLGLFATLHVTVAHAYIGPGVGAGVIAVVLGILSSIFLAFVGILWYPIKRLLKGRKRSANSSVKPQPEAQSTAAGGSAPVSEGVSGTPSAPADRA